MSLDLSLYFDQILDEADKPLFEDAVKSAKAGALRGAYVLIWLSCAESLKRRFKEAQKRDSAAGRIVGEIKNKEENHKPIDKYVLDKAHEYGFLGDSAHNILNHIYEMRCIYGHPYEEGPSDEQIFHAAESAVKLVLSQPVKLKEGFASHVIKIMLEEENYLDDTIRAVSRFAKDILPRIDENLYDWFLEKIFNELEQIADDPTMKVFFKRGKWFSRTLVELATTEIFSKDQWHELVNRFPKTSLSVLTKTSIYEGIGERAQDSIVGSILGMFKEYPSSIRILETLEDKGILSRRQTKRFHNEISKAKIDDLSMSGLSTATCFDQIIKALKSSDWYTQNPAADLVLNNGTEEIEELDNERQVELGRNILQAAEGKSNSCIHFLEHISEDSETWPIPFLKGIAVECFVNESFKIRIKEKRLSLVVKIIGSIDSANRKSIIGEIKEDVNQGQPKYSWFDETDLEKVKSLTISNRWLRPLYSALRKKQKEVSDGQ